MAATEKPKRDDEVETNQLQSGPKMCWKIIYYHKQHCMFIMCLHPRNIITKYDLRNNSYSEFMKIPMPPGCDTSTSMFHGNLIINEKKNQLFIFQCESSRRSRYRPDHRSVTFDAFFVVINLENKQVIINEHLSAVEAKHNLKDVYVCGKPLYVPSPINQIHFICSDSLPANKTKRHILFDDVTNKFVCKNPELPIDSCKSLLFIERKRKLMLLGMGRKGFESDVAFCDIDNSCNWKRSNIELPIKDFDFTAINILDTIIVVIYYRRNEIYLLDLLNGQSGWHRSHKILKQKHVGGVQIITVNNWIHFYDRTRGEHYKIFALDLLLPELYQKYSTMYQDLINGFVKTVKLNVPTVLKTLIVAYYLNIC